MKAAEADTNLNFKLDQTWLILFPQGILIAAFIVSDLKYQIQPGVTLITLSMKKAPSVAMEGRMTFNV